MKKLFLKAVLVSMFAVSGLSFGADKLYVGTNAEFEPFEYLQNGEIVGFDVDLMEEIAKSMGKEIEWKNIAFDGLLPALQERKKFVNFSQTYYESNQMMLVHEKNPVVKSFDELKGHDVGVVLGYTGDIAVSEIEGVKVHRYNATSEAIMALKAQKIDVVVLDSEPAKNYAKQNPELKLINTDVAKEEYAIAVGKNDKELVEDIDKALTELKANGTYDKLIKKYFSEK